MSRGGYKGRENYPHEFEICPKCGKRGFYERSSMLHEGGREKRCKYCKHIIQKR